MLFYNEERGVIGNNRRGLVKPIFTGRKCLYPHYRSPMILASSKEPSPRTSNLIALYIALYSEYLG